jgi:hypothetical protein
VYDTTVITDRLATWNTRSPALSDGNYRLRVSGNTACDQTATVTRDIILDNTPPTVVISTPMACDYVDGVLQIRGTVTDAHLAGWNLSYTGGDSHGWTTIANGIGPVVNGVLGMWDTSELPNCAYTIRLIGTDRANIDCGTRHNQSEYTVSVTAGCDADFNHDGILNSQDFFDFLTSFFAGCP